MHPAARLGAALLIASPLACSTAKAPGSPKSVIARLGDHEVTQGDFAAYLAEALGGPDEVVTAGPDVKSRLLEQLLDEELLLAEARKLQITVSPQEASMRLPVEGIDPGRVQRVLLLKRFKEEVILKGVAVSEEEIRKHFESHIEEYHRPERVVLRKVLTDSAEEARDLRKELETRPGDFEQIAQTRSLAPDGGQPQAFEETMLPDTLRDAVSRLREGELSPVVEDPQGFFILKLEGRQKERAASLEEVRKEIELSLLQGKSQQRYRDYVTALRKKTPVEILPDGLDFTYRSKPPA